MRAAKMVGAVFVGASLCACKTPLPVQPNATAPPTLIKVTANENGIQSSDSETKLWTITARNVSKCNIRLLAFQNGKRHQIEEHWLEWLPGASPDFKLMYAEQEGDLFGAKGQFAPSLGFLFENLKPIGSSFATSRKIFASPRASSQSSTITSSELGKGKEHVVYWKCLRTPENFGVQSEVGALQKASADTEILAVTISW